MNNYFLTMILKEDMDEKAHKELFDDLEKKWKIDNGKWKMDLWGARDLAYPIKKQTKGFYVHCEFEAESGSIKGLDNSLKVEEDILRFLLVRV